MKLCSIDGCSRPLCARGWCRRHYDRWAKWGNPLTIKTYPPFEVRFWAKVDKSSGSTGCWPWTGCRLPKGYGMVGARPRPLYAHRVAYELVVGPIPEGLQIDHLCRNTSCVNPAHLEPVTAAENLRRSREARAA